MATTSEETKWGRPVESAADRWMVELWCQDSEQRAWLLFGQTAEDREELRRWTTDGGAEPTRNERAQVEVEDTFIPGRVVALADYREAA